ncbi:MAG: FecR domain-containing protein [Bacteroidota bacterium]
MYHNSALSYQEVDEKAAWDKFSQNLINEEVNRKNLWFKIAASITILLSVAFIIYFSQFRSQQLQVVSENERIVITFPDGSTGVLNENSQFQYTEKFGDERKVTLYGEAYFDVKKSEKPFIINANGIDIKVLGTAFNLHTTDEKVILFVERGLVAFSKDGDETKITAGLEAVYHKASNQIDIKENSTPNIMSWRNGKFRFRNTPLIEALNDLKEYYKIDFKLSNNNLKNCRISASFNKKSVSEVLNLLEDILDVETKLKDKTVKISGKGC